MNEKEEKSIGKQFIDTNKGLDELFLKEDQEKEEQELIKKIAELSGKISGIESQIYSLNEQSKALQTEHSDLVFDLRELRATKDMRGETTLL